MADCQQYGVVQDNDFQRLNILSLMIIAVGVMMFALCFLILVGTAPIREGLHFHIPKRHICLAMTFAVGVELLNLKI